MDVQIVLFPETKVAVLEHHGPPELEYQTARKLVNWRIEQRLPVERHHSYGIHYTDPRTTPPDQHRVDFCVSVDKDVQPNSFGIVTKVIPACRCAVVRHYGSRQMNSSAVALLTEWLPASREQLGDFPIFFHYVNVGPNIAEADMITDVYLPLETVTDSASS